MFRSNYRTQVLAISALVAFAGIELAPSANGFPSFCFNVHGDITTAALMQLGASGCAITKVIAANVGQDQLEDQGALGSQPGCNLLSLKYAPDSFYRPDHHFDQDPVLSSMADAVQANHNDFAQSLLYLISEWRNVQSYTAAGDYDSALASLGRALHALQDFLCIRITWIWSTGFLVIQAMPRRPSRRCWI